MATGSEMYSLYIEWSTEDETYVARVPELPGCVADGPTWVAAAKAAELVARGWLEADAKLRAKGKR